MKSGAVKRTVLVENVSRRERLENLQTLLNQYAATEPVRHVAEKLDIPDYELGKDLLIDASDLIFDLNPLECVSGTYYPCEESNVCPSIINLAATADSISDPFIASLTSSSNSKSSAKKWLNLVSVDDSSRALCFAIEADYWRTVRALRNSYNGRDSVFSCRCQWRKKEPGTKTRAAIDEIVDISCEVRGSALRLVTGSRQGEVVTVDIKTFKAISLSYNFMIMEKYLVDMKFSNAQWATKQTLEMTCIINYGSESRNYRTKLGGTVTIALTEDLIKNGSAAFAIRNGPQKSDAAIVGEHIFQFDQLISGTTSVPKFDEAVTSELPLQTSTGRRMAKLTIYRATDLICLSGRTPPNPFCQIFLLDANKLKVKSSNDTKTYQQKKTQNPVWNTEFELHGPQGIEGVEFVMILIKDGSGIIDKKPLGQVVIPISTFLFGQNEPEITLKIEPAEKMQKAGTALGSIVIHAEVATIATSTLMKMKAIGKNTSNVQSGNASLGITPRLTNEYSTWWPIMPLAEPSDESGRVTLSAGINSLGHAVWGFDRMLIRLTTNSAPVATFRESFNGSSNTLRVPWNQVRSVDALTDTVAIVSMILTKDDPANTSSNKPSAYGKSQPPGVNMLWEMLVCPCPAAKLVALWKERKALVECRVQLKNFLKGSFGGVQLSASQSLPSARAVMESVEQHLSGIAGEQQLTPQSEARIHFYLAQLLHGCRSMDGGPVYDKAVVRKLVKTDCESDRTVATTGGAGEIASAKVIKKVEFIIDCAITRIRDYVLCCWEPFTSSTQSGVGCLEEMVNCYLQEIRSMLASYVGSKKTLQLLKGMENRIQLVAFLIREELRFDMILRKLLSPFRLLCRPQARLLEAENMDALLAWFNSTLLDELKIWLRRQLDQAKIAKTNVHGLPWDYENVGGFYRSQLPEQLIGQLSSYLELRVPHPPHNAMEEERERARRVNDRILRAYGQGILLLADEYKKTFQSKNWCASNPAEVVVDTCFVVSVVNDCYRLGGIHTDPYRDTVMITPSSDDVAFTLISQFNGTAEVGLKFLVKMAFADVKPKFAEFDKQWATQLDTASLVGTITVALTNKISVIQPIMDPFYYAKLVAGACDVCVFKYLLFLRGKSESGASAKLNKLQIKRIQTDVQQWTACFKGLSANLDPRVINSKLQCLEDVRDLLCLDAASPQYLEAVQRLARRYCVEGKAANTRFLHATVALRADGNFRIQQAINDIIAKYKDAPNSGDVDPNDDLLIRAFGDDSDSKKSKGFGFFLKSSSNAEKADTGKGKDGTASSTLDGDDDMPDFDKLSDADVSDTASTQYGEAASESGGDGYPIEVSCLKVRGLKTGSLISAANPYVKIILNAQRFKTNVRWNSRNAVWDDFTMNFHVATSNLASKHIIAIVYDKERLRRKTLLGTVKISLANIDRSTLEGWFTMENVVNPNDAQVVRPLPSGTSLPESASCGQVHMRIRLLGGKY